MLYGGVIINSMKLKSIVKKKALELNMKPQIALQNLMFEAFLKRLSYSEFASNFIVKGGVLVSSIVGLSNRSTTDLDTTLRNITMDSQKLVIIIKDIISIDCNDGINFNFISINEIRKDMFYNGYSLRLDGCYENIICNISIDITSGDSITPQPITYNYKCIFSDEVISIQSYNIESVLAEKIDAILSRDVSNTRAKDYYDVYILSKQIINFSILKDALLNTFRKRNHISLLYKYDEILNLISVNNAMLSYWNSYKNKFPYADEVSFEDTILRVRYLLDIVLS